MISSVSSGSFVPDRAHQSCFSCQWTPEPGDVHPGRTANCSGLSRRRSAVPALGGLKQFSSKQSGLCSRGWPAWSRGLRMVCLIKPGLDQPSWACAVWGAAYTHGQRQGPGHRCCYICLREREGHTRRVCRLEFPAPWFRLPLTGLVIRPVAQERKFSGSMEQSFSHAPVHLGEESQVQPWHPR